MDCSRGTYITLSSTCSNEIPRRLKLGSAPVIIGRASKTESRGMQARSDNALFECPVISREHAEIEAHPNMYGEEEEVTITDRGSMHGTYVNDQALKRDVPFTLQDGDMIQFGTNVARGNDTFKGVTVVFKKDDQSAKDDGRSTRSTYSVPAESEPSSELSDYDNEEIDYGDELEDDVGDLDDTVDLDAIDCDPVSDFDDDCKDEHDSIQDEDDDVELSSPQASKDIGSAQKPIEVESWPSGSLRNVMDLTQPEPAQVQPVKPIPSKFPWEMPPPKNFTIVPPLFNHARAPVGLPAIVAPPSKSMSTNPWLDAQDEEEFRLRQPSVELSTPRPATQKTAPLANSKPRYDPVRGSPPRSSNTIDNTPSVSAQIEAVEKSAPTTTTIPVPPARPVEPLSDDALTSLLATATPVKPLSDEELMAILNGASSSKPISLDELLGTTAEQEAKTKSKPKSKKRKADSAFAQQADDNLAEVIDKLLGPPQPPAKKPKLKQTSRMQSFLSDARKYAFGAALGATGTFTFLASPLGGALADWASKF